MATILIVEDNEMNRELLSRRLSRRGYEILSAADGETGIEMGATSRPDLILMDMTLPGIDGWEATRRLRARPETSAIPVIALTGHDGEDARQQALKAGCDDFDTKPFEMSRLVEKIEKLLGGAPP